MEPSQAPIRPPGLKLLLTTSSMKTSRRCRKLYRLRYRDGYRPVADAPRLSFGSCVHDGQEAWWLTVAAGPGDGSDAFDPLACALAAMRRPPKKGRQPLDRYQQARAEAMMRAYDQRWRGAPLMPLAVEVQFRAPLTNPATGRVSRTYEQGGKIDVVVQALDAWGPLLPGDVALMEHKTAAEDCGPGTVYQRRLRLDPQVTTYYEGAAALGYQVKACVYDVLRKPMQRPGQATPEDQRETTLPKYKACPSCKIKGNAPGPHAFKLGGADTFDGLQVECGQPVQITLADGKVMDVPGEAGKVLTDPPRYKANVRLQDETPEDYGARCFADLVANLEATMVRFPVVRLESEIAQHRANLWAQAGEQRAVDNALAAGDDAAAFMNPDGCVAYGSTCDFFDVCTGAASLDDPKLFTRVENPHTELADDASQPQEV